jgi:hypothetical protein
MDNTRITFMLNMLFVKILISNIEIPNKFEYQMLK